jgi:hypothetical protein
MKNFFLLSISCFFVFVAAAQSFTTSKLPIVVINTNGQNIPDDPKITADMGIIYNGAGAINSLTGTYNHYNGKIGIEIRGQSSQQFPMKNYSIELRDTAGASINKSILGLPSESDWVLYAPYTDKTLMRNVLAYTMSKEMGNWASNCRYVEVVLNNNYIGVYVLMEKIKRGSGRVNISKLNATDISGDALTGGYIFAIDKVNVGDDGWYSATRPPNAINTNQKIHFLYNYPKAANIGTEQKNYIKSFVDSFETALNAPHFQDTVNGFRKFINVNSFIDFLIVNEVSRNIDGYRLSTYLNKDKSSKGGKLNAGPVWDYDLAFRNVNYCNGNLTAGWAYDFNSLCNNDFYLMPFWWQRFMQDTAFKSSLRCRWKQLRQTSLSNQHLLLMIDSVNTILDGAQQRHFQKWPILGQYIWPNPQPIPATYTEEISTLKQWLTFRLDWMDNNMPNIGACSDWPINAKGTILFWAYPNPINNSSTFLLQSKQHQTLSLRITDASGRVMHSQTITVNAGMQNIKNIPASQWAHGVYNFTFTNTQGETLTKKLIKE